MTLSVPQCVQQNSASLGATFRYLVSDLCPKFMPNGWYGGRRWKFPPFCLRLCIRLHPHLIYIIKQPIVSLAKVITANIPVKRMAAVNKGSTMEGEAKTWLGSIHGTAVCVLSIVQLKRWVVHEQRKPNFKL